MVPRRPINRPSGISVQFFPEKASSYQRGGAARIDSVFLGEKPPERANSPDGKTYKRKLSKRDCDVIDAHGKTIDFVFGSGVQDNTLSITDRIEGERIGKYPFQFPIANTYKDINKKSAFYRYRPYTRLEGFA